MMSYSNTSTTNPLVHFMETYTEKTQLSKQNMRDARHCFADSRASAGFRLSIKELLYPIVGLKANGAHFIDIDGNEYVDVTMGYGSLLFGHAYPPLTDALKKQLEKGIQIGPQAEKAAEVARLFSELLGLERVAFCNSGTEANMLAFRLARLKTNKHKIVLFDNSYHGSYDSTLVTTTETPNLSAPLYGGLPPSMVQDIIVLPYGDCDALECLEQQAKEIAAVIIEPVRSRFPEVVPSAFLQTLRNLTKDRDIALIFDEVVTGFRCHLAGAQAYFDIKADIVTYGKIIGGGLPIGIVAGNAEYLDGVDGGNWHYFDQSFPQREATFFGGTFYKNALSITAAHTMLTELKKLGPSVQERLTIKTENLAHAINSYCQKNHLALEVVSFSSLFRFKFKGNFDLLFYTLIFHGIYVWEGRNCFLSEAHSDADIEFLKAAIINSLDFLKKWDLLPSHLIRKGSS